MSVTTSEIKGATISIKVFGIGGGGNNVLKRLANNKIADLELIAVNTDAKQLDELKKYGISTLQIGNRYTKGRGTGGNVEVGANAALDDAEKISAAMRGADLVFITSSMGGGLGTGAAPIVAKIAREMDILSVGVVTLPFGFEGSRKMKLATDGVTKMQSYMDALIIIKNDNLLKLPENRSMSMVQAFNAADDILRQAILCISEVLLTTGLVNVDFADLYTTFRKSDSSDAILGIGFSEKGLAIEAVKNAIESPLIERSLQGAKGIVLNISGSEALTLFEITDATHYINENTHEDVNIILGIVIDKNLGNSVRATIVATDFIDSVVVKTPQLGKIQKQLSDFTVDVPNFMLKKSQVIPNFKLSTDKQ